MHSLLPKHAPADSPVDLASAAAAAAAAAPSFHLAEDVDHFRGLALAVAEQRAREGDWPERVREGKFERRE